MAAPEHRHVAAARPVPLSPQLQRELWTIIEGFWPDDQAEPLDGMAEAIVKWQFDRELVGLPHGTTIATAEYVHYPTSALGDSDRLWLPPPAGRPPRPPAPARRPSLREIGAEPIDGRRDGQG